MISFFILLGSTNDSSIIVRGCFKVFLLCRLLYIVITYNYNYKTIILSCYMFPKLDLSHKIYMCVKRDYWRPNKEVT